MSERPHAAVLLSVLAHAALIVGAAFVSTKVAAGNRASGWATSVTEDFEAIQSGLYGNTFDIDGFVEGELGFGKAKTPAPPTGDVKPSRSTEDPPRKARKSRRKRAKRPRKSSPRSKPSLRRKPPANTPATGANQSAAARSNDGASSDDGASSKDARQGDKQGVGAGDGGRQHGTSEAKSGELTAAAAFTHALAISFSANPLWHKLPLGEAGTAVVTLTVENGKVTGTEVPKGAPKLIRKLVRGAAAMTRLRRIDGEGATRMRISVALSQRAVPERDDLDGTVVLQAKDTAPTPDTAGGVFFTFASGRHVQITITIE